MNNPLDPNSGGLKNGYTDIPDQPVDAIADRVQPRQMGSGINRGAQVVVGSTGLPQVLSGVQSTFGPGFYVAKDNIDAVTNTDPTQWRFNSNQNNFKIVTSSTHAIIGGTLASAVVGVTAAAGGVIIPHGLSYTPAVIAYVNDDGDFSAMPYLTGLLIGSSAYAQEQVFIVADATNITIRTFTTLQVLVAGAAAFGPFTYSVKYYLLQETAN